MTVDVLRAAGVAVRARRRRACGGSSRARSRARLDRRARPVQRGAVPRRGPGHRRLGHDAAAGPRRRPRPATSCATCSPRWARDIHLSPRRAHDRARAIELLGLDADLHDVGELTPGRSPRSARSPTTPSHLPGIAHLRGHETDRLAALATEINAPRRGRDRRGRLAADHPRAAARRRVALLRRPPDGDRRRGARTRRAAASRSTTSTRPRKTLPDFPGMWAAMVGA